jgi:hypothetical protein
MSGLFVLSKQKCQVFFLQKWRTGRQNRSCLGFGTNGRGEDIRKRCRKVNMVEILCTHICKWKNAPVETFPGIVEGNKVDNRWGEFKYNML